MDELRDYIIGAVVGLGAFFGIGLLVASAYTGSWKKDCDSIGATVVDGIAYKCERLPAKKEPQP